MHEYSDLLSEGTRRELQRMQNVTNLSLKDLLMALDQPTQTFTTTNWLVTKDGRPIRMAGLHINHDTERKLDPKLVDEFKHRILENNWRIAEEIVPDKPVTITCVKPTQPPYYIMRDRTEGIEPVFKPYFLKERHVSMNPCCEIALPVLDVQCPMCGREKPENTVFACHFCDVRVCQSCMSGKWRKHPACKFCAPYLDDNKCPGCKHSLDDHIGRIDHFHDGVCKNLLIPKPCGGIFTVEEACNCKVLENLSQKF